MRSTLNKMSKAASFSVFALITRNLRHYWRSNLAVILGTTVSVAALTGSLFVGDSVRGTLQDLALERLGNVDYSISSPEFFREKLAGDLAAELLASKRRSKIVPAILAKCVAQNLASGITLPEVNILGVTDDFIKLSPDETSRIPDGQKIAVNSQLADELGISVGDSILLTVGQKDKAPARSVFARRTKDETLRSMRLTVEEILPTTGIGRFALASKKGKPRNVYMSLDSLQQRLGLGEKANTILVASSADQHSDVNTIRESLLNSVRLEDFGLRIVPNSSLGYFSLESDNLVLSIPIVKHALQSAAAIGLQAEASSMHMANSIAKRTSQGPRKEIPYSVIASIPRLDVMPFGPLPTEAGNCSCDFEWGEGGLLNAWAAEDLGASIGDEIEITYYATNESNMLQTRSRKFLLRGIVSMEGIGTDPGVVPSFDGVTNANSMADWDPPFPINLSKIRPKDETYWDDYRTTPKVYLHPLHLQYLWEPWNVPNDQKPLAWITSVRIAPSDKTDLTTSSRGFAKMFLKTTDPEHFGITVASVRQNALEAAKGSSDFGILFLSMSLFVVLSASGLVGLLFRLAVEQRSSQHGIMVATGFKAKRVRQVLMGEGIILATVGVALGAPLGIGYAALIILGLRTVWNDAAGDFAFNLHVTPASLIIGCISGFMVALIAMRWALRVLRNKPVLTTLFGRSALVTLSRPRTQKLSSKTSLISIAAAAVFLVVGFLSLLPVEITFFVSGILAMVSLLSFFCVRLQKSGEAKPIRNLTLWRLCLDGTSRNWVRSILTCGAMACACFILVTVAANRRDLTRLDVYRHDSGSGGFSLIAHATTPINVDLNVQESLRSLALLPEDLSTFDETDFYGFPVSEGDDISCLNIQQPQRPTLLGVPKEIIDRNAFRFTETLTPSNIHTNIQRWELLTQDISSNNMQIIPAIADAASAQWILHVGIGDQFEVKDQNGNPVYLQIVGLLNRSVFQGEVLISEENFRRHFDADAGDSYYLIATQPEQEQEVAQALRQSLADYGFDVQRTAEALADYAGVQNAYLNTFQTLGGLGFLLGTLGIVTVLLRNVVERRGELAMLLALGFQRKQVIRLLLMENGLLLVVGTFIGTLAALLAITPHWSSTVSKINWIALATTLMTCVASGLLSCYIAAAFSVRKDLLSTLRSE